MGRWLKHSNNFYENQEYSINCAKVNLHTDVLSQLDSNVNQQKFQILCLIHRLCLFDILEYKGHNISPGRLNFHFNFRVNDIFHSSHYNE